MNQQNPIRVRFAPSPTGWLHVGGARTALFNWLYARQQNAPFVLRIEDSDTERSTEESYAAILRGLEWLGLDWDEGPGVGGDHGPYLQSERLEIYREQLQKLLASGHAYACYCSDDEIQARKAAAAGGDQQVAPGYDGHCRELSDSQRSAFEAEGRRPCWRMRTPSEGNTFWYDIVSGKLEFQNSELSDRVLVKANGFPTYNFAVVVDDHLMGISHVLRGDDHLSNTPFQLQMYDALEFPRPKFGHMPMILGPDRKRLSKRHGATSVEQFRELGILPDALVNYIALLGWSVGAAGDEVLTRDQLVKKFSLKKVNSSPAAFDYDKLNHINGEHIKRLTPAARVELALPLLAERDWQVDPTWLVPGGDDTNAYLDRVLKILGNRFSSLVTLPEQIGFFFTEDYPVDDAAMSEHLDSAEARQRVNALAEAVAAGMVSDGPTPAARFEEIVRQTAESLNLKAGQLIHPGRVALTGQARSAGMFEVMELIGGPRVVVRLRRAASNQGD
jgi:glutamyl-tRNA synthetase